MATKQMSGKAAARALGVSIVTVYRNCANGKYPGAVKVGGKWLIPADMLERLRRQKDGE